MSDFNDVETQHQFAVGTRVHFSKEHPAHPGKVGTVKGFERTIVGIGMRCSVDGWCSDTMVFRMREIERKM